VRINDHQRIRHDLGDHDADETLRVRLRTPMSPIFNLLIPSTNEKRTPGLTAGVPRNPPAQCPVSEIE
jgi:hypothetical protein